MDGNRAKDASLPQAQVRSRMAMCARACFVVGACGAALVVGGGTAQAYTATATTQADAAVEYDGAPADDAGQATPEEEKEILAMVGDGSVFSPGEPPAGLDPSAPTDPSAELQSGPDGTVSDETGVDPEDDATESATQERRTCGGETGAPRQLYPYAVVYVKGITECKKHRVYVSTSLWVQDWYGWRFVNANLRQDWKYVSTSAAWRCDRAGAVYTFRAESYQVGDALCPGRLAHVASTRCGTATGCGVSLRKPRMIPSASSRRGAWSAAM